MIRNMGLFEGQGEETMDFFVHELKPYIDDHYRTKKQERIHLLVEANVVV